MSTALPKPGAGGAAAAARSLPSRLMTAFSGPVGLAVKIVLLGIVNALALWAGVVLAGEGNWLAVGVLVLTTLAIDAIYLLRRGTLPLKFLIPGTIFLLAFQVVPIAYTINVAFTNYSTGHILSKSEAIEGINRNSLEPPADGKTYVMAPARDEDGELVLLLVDEADGSTFVGSPDGIEPLARETVRISPDGVIVDAHDYELVKGNALFTLDKELETYTVPTGGSSAIRPEGLEAALELKPSLRHDEAADTFTRVSDGQVFRDNGRGSFATAAGEELEPGWRTTIGLDNVRRVFQDPLVRDPFVRVFIWTLAFAVLTVGLSFFIGLFLAITLDKKIRFQRFYRTVLVVPYAIPAFLTILVWAGLLNDDFGVVNKLLHTSIPWLFDPTWAKVSVLLVALWLSFPYFFLVSLGALQSIPGELVEAARVDGAGAWQVFRKITLPLLLVAVAPLLIASFAFNFNNFNNIYLLTGGGPPSEDQSIAGATDILISYTYKLAFEAGKGQDYALAAAVSIFIFFIVATISGAAFWRSKALENVR
ncbi:MAG: ABC transporter permease subunit [Actinobacteria bacterium]|nr:ABC transporter permease subunit [Actinomycetota bacterium]